MENFQELKEYVAAQAVAYKAADESWESDTIELNVFREILRFAVSEGLEADARAVNRVLNGEDEQEEYDEEENYTDWHYMGILMEQMEEQIHQQVLPAATTALYKMWLAESRGIGAGYWG